MANYENRKKCQNFIRTVLIEGVSCQFVVGKQWRKSNNWIFLKYLEKKFWALFLTSPIAMAKAHTLTEM